MTGFFYFFLYYFQFFALYILKLSKVYKHFFLMNWSVHYEITPFISINTPCFEVYLILMCQSFLMLSVCTMYVFSSFYFQVTIIFMFKDSLFFSIYNLWLSFGVFIIFFGFNILLCIFYLLPHFYCAPLFYLI